MDLDKKGIETINVTSCNFLDLKSSTPADLIKSQCSSVNSDEIKINNDKTNHS